MENKSEEIRSKVKEALARLGISYSEQMPTVKIPLMKLAQVDVRKNAERIRYTVDLSSSDVVHVCAIAERPLTF